MNRHFNIRVYRTNEEFSVFFKVEESKVLTNYDGEDIINLAIDSGKLSEKDSDIVASIEEISQKEYIEATQGFMLCQKTV